MIRVEGDEYLEAALTEVSAKIRSGAVQDDEEDYALPVWAGLCHCTCRRVRRFAMSAAIRRFRRLHTQQTTSDDKNAVSPVSHIPMWIASAKRQREGNQPADRNP